MECFGVNQIRGVKQEIIQIHCKDEFKRKGKFEGADNVIAAIISAAV